MTFLCYRVILMHLLWMMTLMTNRMILMMTRNFLHLLMTSLFWALSLNLPFLLRPSSHCFALILVLWWRFLLDYFQKKFLMINLLLLAPFLILQNLNVVVNGKFIALLFLLSWYLSVGYFSPVLFGFSLTWGLWMVSSNRPFLVRLIGLLTYFPLGLVRLSLFGFDCSYCSCVVIQGVWCFIVYSIPF